MPKQNRTNSALYRYAWSLFMEHYREGRTRTGAGDFCMRGTVSGLAALYCGVELYARWHTHDVAGIILAATLEFILLWSFLNSVRGIALFLRRAADFAEDASLIASSPKEVEQYFDEQYPWLFYHK